MQPGCRSPSSRSTGRTQTSPPLLNGAEHLAASGDLYVAFADNLYPEDNPLLALRAAPAGHTAVLARAYEPELAASRGVIAAVRRHGEILPVIASTTASRVIDLGADPPCTRIRRLDPDEPAAGRHVTARPQCSVYVRQLHSYQQTR